MRPTEHVAELRRLADTFLEVNELSRGLHDGTAERRAARELLEQLLRAMAKTSYLLQVEVTR
jgi:hypothetical protein